MEIRQYWRIIWRRVWLPIGLLVLVAGFSAALHRPQPPQYVATARLLVDVPPLKESEGMGFDPRLTAPQATEYLVDDFSVFVTGDVVAQGVGRRLAEQGISIPAGLIQSSTSSQQLHRVVVFQATWGDADQAMAIVRAAVDTLQKEAPAYFGRLGELQPEIRVFDGPKVSAVATPLSHRLDIPIRLVLALLVGVAACFAWHYLDPVVRDRAEVEALGIPVLAQVLGKRRWW